MASTIKKGQTLKSFIITSRSKGPISSYFMEFKLENIHSFSKALLPLKRFHDVADLKCSPTMFSLIISRHFPLIITSLQLLPPFFTTFHCHNQIFQYQFPIKSLYDIINTMKHKFYSSMKLSLHHQQPLNQIYLQFHNPRAVDPQEVLFHAFPLSPSREEDVGEIDYGIFVSIESQVFQLIATELDDFNALVTVTSSQVKFSVDAKEISLQKERNECIIGGVAGEEESLFFVYISPRILYRDLGNESERIWIFKSPNSYSIIVAPIGLYAQICVYFPQIEEQSKRQKIC